MLIYLYLIFFLTTLNFSYSSSIFFFVIPKLDVFRDNLGFLFVLDFKLIVKSFLKARNKRARQRLRKLQYVKILRSCFLDLYKLMRQKPVKAFPVCHHTITKSWRKLQYVRYYAAAFCFTYI